MTTAGHVPRQELISAASSAWLLMELWILLRSRRAMRGEGRDRGSFAVLALGNWVSLAAMAAGGLIGLGWRIRVEEQALHTRFGAAWEAYAARRWAVIPFLW